MKLQFEPTRLFKIFENIKMTTGIWIYCKSCVYNPKERTGKNACPFNFFYWNFLEKHREKLQNQGRMSFILKNLDKMSEEELSDIRQQVQDWHKT